LKLSLSSPKAFLIDYLRRAFFISSSIIKLLIAFIEGSIIVTIFIELAIGSRNAIFRKISSFSSIIVAKSLLASFIARVAEEALEEVYFSAI
jgi:cytochrome c oxidase subunit IV